MKRPLVEDRLNHGPRDVRIAPRSVCVERGQMTVWGKKGSVIFEPGMLGTTQPDGAFESIPVRFSFPNMFSVYLDNSRALVLLSGLERVDKDRMSMAQFHALLDSHDYGHIELDSRVRGGKIVVKLRLSFSDDFAGSVTGWIYDRCF
jgi:hypothetical protein